MLSRSGCMDEGDSEPVVWGSSAEIAMNRARADDQL